MSGLYLALNSEAHQIRRLRLLAGEFDDSLRGALEIVSLDGAPQYEALSYVWGQELASAPMLVSNTELPITANLDVALRHLRMCNEERVLWVDAVCINQNDLDEKAQQVRMMRRIYYLAPTVRVWLGPPTHDGDIAMKSVADFDKDHWQTLDFQVQFMDILYRPWFTRIWIVQEFALCSGNLLVGCGYQWTSWISFITAWSHFTDNMNVINQEYESQCRDHLSTTFQPTWDPQASPKANHLEVSSDQVILKSLLQCFGEDALSYTGHASLNELIHDIKQNRDTWRSRYAVMRWCSYESPIAKTYWRRLELTQRIPIHFHGFLMHARGVIIRKQQFLSFEEVLKGTMNLRSTDPRDKIYGMLGLVSPNARNSIPIDYHKPAHWTFVPTMVYMISYEAGGLAFLGLLWSRRPFNIPFPSWVPDFTMSADWKDEHSPVFLRGSCANATWSWPMNASVSADHRVLSATGISFGKATKLIRFAEGSREDHVAQLRAIEELANKTSPNNEPIWRTLIGVRNTDRTLLGSGLPFGIRWNTLVDQSSTQCTDIRAAGCASQLLEFILDILRGKTFFTTNEGFAGVSTPDIQEGDRVALVFGMVRPAVLRSVEPKVLGIETELEGKVPGFVRVVGFAYVGCHDRDAFESMQKQGLQGWKEHRCYACRESERYHII